MPPFNHVKVEERKMRVTPAFALCSFLIATAVSSAAIAQQTDPNVCAVLAGKVTPDISSQFTSYDRFALFQQLIHDQRFSSFDTANSTTLDAGLSVVGYVDAFLGTTSNASAWSQNWQNFLQATYSQASVSFNQSSFTSTWSPDLITAIANCNNFYGILTSITPGHDGFSIKVHGIGQWSLTGVAVTPPDPSFACAGDEKASSAQPISFINDHILQCKKDPNITLSVAIHDSQQDVGPFSVLSVADDLRREQTSQLQQLQSTISLLQTQLTKINSVLAAQVQQARADLLQWPQGNAWNAGTTCPAGQYAVGITYQTESGLAHGAVYAAQVICRPLNAAVPLQ
jgi:hypothetical protein